MFHILKIKTKAIPNFHPLTAQIKFTMRNFIVQAFFVCSLLFAFSAFGQRSYIQIGSGYGTTFGPGWYPSSNSYETSKGISQKITENFSLGKGFQFAGIFGREWNDFISTEFAVSYLYGSSFKSNFISDIQGEYFNLTQTTEGRMLRLIPTIKVFGGKKNLRPYLKSGIILSLGTVANYENVTTSNLGSGEYQFSEATGQISGGNSIGYFGALGVDIALKQNFHIFSEIALCAQTFIPEKDKLETFKVNKQNYFGKLTQRDKETLFVNEITQADLENLSKSSPRKQIRIFLPFSSVGINLGVKFYLTSNPNETKKD